MKLVAVLALLMHAKLTWQFEKKVWDNLLELDNLIESEENVSKRAIHCVPLKFDQLMSQYKASTGYNHLYVASTPTDAILFPNLLWDAQTRAKYDKALSKTLSLLPVLTDQNNTAKLLALKNVIEQYLRVPLTKNTGMMLNVTKRSTSYSVNTGVCSVVGDVDPTTKLVNLCNQCSTTTTRSDDRFPRYINEVTCSSKPCFRNEGICKQITMPIDLLKKSKKCQAITQNGQTVFVEKWVKSPEIIRIACECQLKADSPLKRLLF